MKHFRQFVRPHTLDEAVSLKKAIGARALYIAGGTGVVPFGAKSVEVLIDLTRLGLDGIVFGEDAVTVGATTRLADMLVPGLRAAVPALYDAIRECATPLVRNAATIGGSLASVFLPSDPAVAMLAVGADIETRGDTDRTVAIGDLVRAGWLNGYEIVRRVSISKREPGDGTCFLKFGRSGVDIALVNAAAQIRMNKAGRIESLRVAVGQSSSLPVLLDRVAEEAHRQPLSETLVQNLAKSASEDVKPRSDHRASGDYRKHLVEVLVARCIRGAAREAGHNLES